MRPYPDASIRYLNRSHDTRYNHVHDHPCRAVRGRTGQTPLCLELLRPFYHPFSVPANVAHHHRPGPTLRRFRAADPCHREGTTEPVTANIFVMERKPIIGISGRTDPACVKRA